jgi:tetratricopeptide (TPR) repeat protein
MARILFFLLLINTSAIAQKADEYYREGIELETKFKVEEALEKFELAIKSNPRHGEAFMHASRMLSNIGGRLPKSARNEKQKYYNKAKQYAERALELIPNNPNAHLANIVALGLQSEIAINPHEKVRDARDIHQAAINILKIDSTFSEAYFVLGKWQYELSGLNWMELMACKIFFGGFPEAISYEAAYRYFMKAIQYKPNSILFLYGLASTQHALKDDKKALQTLNKALSLPLAEPDDIERKSRCEALLKQIVK